MQIDATTGYIYDERKSADGHYEYSIIQSNSGFDVDCWNVDNNTNHWHKWFKTEDKVAAIAEFNRFT